MGADIERDTRPAVILHVEENGKVREIVRDVLEFAGWYVNPHEAFYGLALIESREHFDLLLINRESRQSLDGLRLVRRARELPHRRGTPTYRHRARGLRRGGARGGRGRLPAQV